MALDSLEHGLVTDRVSECLGIDVRRSGSAVV